MRYQLGFDIGGTFTDFALLDTASGNLEIFKALTTPADPAQGALDGMRTFLNQAELSLRDIDYIVHATTLVANTLIERKGARVGLITTQGFRDILEIRTEQRYDIFDLFLRYPAPLSPRYLRRGIRERVDRDGRLIEAIDPQEVSQVIGDFMAQGVEAIAVCFLHAFRNPTNERRVGEMIEAAWPGLPISLSSTVAPEIREYERSTTTVANAYVQPLLALYLGRLSQELQQAKFEGAFYPMLSSGSVCPLSVAVEQPIRMVESGPAAGAIAASHFGALAEHRTLLSFDMGGTTAKLCLIDDGQPTIAPNLEVARVHRFRKGSGFPLQFPTVDMLEIGAGGGSIAWIDALGLIKVGPESAGSSPGPACYGFGGQQPTVTDADLVLGYLNPDYFLGGEMKLDAEAAGVALRQVAGPFDHDIIRTADSIHRLVNENMASAAKIHVLEQAGDPRKYALMCFGGAGPVHAAGVAKILGSSEVLVPPNAGVAAALGLLIAPAAFDFVRSYPTRLDSVNWLEIQAVFEEMENRGLVLLAEAGVPQDEAVIKRSVAGRFEGQLHEIELTLPLQLEEIQPVQFADQFMAQYQALYRHLPSQMPIELLTWRVTVAGRSAPSRSTPAPTAGPSASKAQSGSRRAYFHEAGDFLDTPVFDRYRLRPGMRLPGPAIVEERESTAVIRPGMSGLMDEHLNLQIRL